ncbi:hypothetical protein JMJ77_0013152 [Colletotrichum scovillei]|uniref:Uncharacterized protein n=1 Tax=Colletotrichum scovillei TaxID=1209932 RepID=A0A9P7UCE7_9PEZI|nr:hypothetical protein JMJ77_0013152 [Colletotrichum scovillei]KAG7069444.1 hypothetical protein JMJ76_0003114 [Colletotrichum scovillei]KAG7073422.1 hypothetical protein JMJ78_0014397 [Colletotrichum scovillei]
MSFRRIPRMLWVTEKLFNLTPSCQNPSLRCHCCTETSGHDIKSFLLQCCWQKTEDSSTLYTQSLWRLCNRFLYMTYLSSAVVSSDEAMALLSFRLSRG